MTRFGFPPLVCSCCCLLVLCLGGSDFLLPPTPEGPNPHTCSSLKANLRHLLSALKKRLIQRLLASLLQTSMSPTSILVVIFLSSPEFLSYFFFPPDLVCPLHPASVPQSLQPTQTQNCVLAHSISSPICVCGSSHQPSLTLCGFRSITLKTSFCELIDQAGRNISLVAGNETETRRKGLWSVKANCTRHISGKVHMRLWVLRDTKHEFWKSETEVDQETSCRRSQSKTGAQPGD